MFNDKLFRSKVVLNGLTLAETANRIGINESTLHKKLSNDGSFTRAEIMKLITVLELSPQDVQNIFFAE